MAVPTTNPITTPSTITAAQTRALLYALLSSNPNAHGTPSAPPRPAATIRPVRQQPATQQSITIDTSNRIIGHCNNVALAPPSSIEQAVMLKESVCSILRPVAQGEDKATAKGNVNLNVIIQAGVNIMGSKNVIVFNGKRDASTDDTKVDVPLTERKRKAESDSADSQTPLTKKAKVEE